MRLRIQLRHMMATTAIHMTGDISSDNPDLCLVNEEDDENYYGVWVTGFGFIGVRFPKETTRPLTTGEIDHYESMTFQLASNRKARRKHEKEYGEG